MSISIFNVAATQTAQFSKANSGYASTTAGPTTNTYSMGTTSGNCYLKQTPVTSGTTFSVDLVSGGLTDLVGNTINMSKLLNAQVLPASGAIQVETYQSGGLAIPTLSTQSGYPSSGYGVLVNPAGVLMIGENFSGAFVALSATKGNLVFRAVSGDCLLSFGAYGL